MISGNGSSRRRNSEDGTPALREVKVEVLFYFAMEIPVSVKHLLGTKSSSQRWGESEPVLTSIDDSSLLVDRLCDQTSGQNTAVSCFYLDFATRKEQCATHVLGSLLKQIVGGMERIPEEISRAFQQQKMTIGGCRPKLIDIVNMLGLITSSRRTFMCLDGLDECAGVERLRLLNALREILEEAPETRIFVTGRPYIQGEIESRLAGQMASFSVTSTISQITRYLRFRLDHDEMPDAMDESLQAEILEKIPENMSQMYQSQ